MHLTRGHTALRKSVDRIQIGSENVGVIHERPFLHQHFSMKIDRIFKNCSCFIDYRLLMLYRILLNWCIQQEDILHYLTALTESKSFKNVGNIHDWPFLYRNFCMKIDLMFHRLRLLMLYWILLNFKEKDIMHYFTALTE